MIEEPLQAAQSVLAGHPANIILDLPFSGAMLMRRDSATGLESMLYDPLICMVLQGEKRVQAGTHDVTCGPGSLIVVSHALPIVSKITLAWAKAPYIAFIMPLDLSIFQELSGSVPGARLNGRADPALAIKATDFGLCETVARLLRLSGDSHAGPILAPIARRELHARLLLSPIGATLARRLWRDNPTNQIARAIERIQASVGAPLTIADLAAHAGMSRSSFHAHFRSVTGQSPIQFQKEIRLLAAQRMILGEDRAIASVAYEVGYESPAQFSRDYTRKFGVTPRQDRQTDRSPSTAIA